MNVTVNRVKDDSIFSDCQYNESLVSGCDINAASTVCTSCIIIFVIINDIFGLLGCAL